MKKTDGAFVRSVVLKRVAVDDFDAYPFSIPAIRQLDELALDPHVTLLAGENGSGKSTLIEAIAVAAGFNAEGGSRTISSQRDPSSSSRPTRQYCSAIRARRSMSFRTRGSPKRRTKRPRSSS